MEKVIMILTEAFSNDNLSSAFLMCVVLFFLYFANILLGTILGTMQSKFNIKKFAFGILKAICVLLIIVGVCYILNVFTLTISLINGLTINTELVSTLELLGILVTSCIDISKEVLEKIKAFRELKYISYDDVIKNDTEVNEPINFVG